MRIIVCGAGIAGLTVALRLQEAGHRLLIVERAPGVRDAGYMIDFFGSGFDAAEKMGLLDELESIHYPIRRLTFVSRSGSERFSIPYTVLRKRLFDNRHFNFMRGDLEHVLYSHLDRDTEVRFGTTIKMVSQRGEGLVLQLSDGSSEECDLLVGADGVHSQVRALAFGPESEFSRYLGFHTAAFILDRIPESLQSMEGFMTLTVPNRQVAVYPIRGGRLATSFFHHSDKPAGTLSQPAALKYLEQAYGDLSWFVPGLLLAARATSYIYYDDVTQIEIERWSSGRVVLLGDACQCVSLIAGQGASMAVAGAFVLAEELNRCGSIEEALERYQSRVKPSIDDKQRAGRKVAKWFVPNSSIRLFIRDLALRLSVLPLASRLVRGLIAPDSIFRDR